MGTSILHLLPYTLVLQNGAEATGSGTEMDLHGKYGSLTIQVFGTFSGTITFEAIVTEKSPSAWTAIPGTNVVTDVRSTTTTAAGIFSFPVTGYHAFRARVSARASGSIYAVGTAVPCVYPVIAASVNGLAAEDAAVSGNPVLIAGRYDSSARTLDDGDAGTIALDAAGRVQAVLGAGTAAIGSVTIGANISEWSVTGNSATNTAKTITKAAEAGKKHVVTAFEVVISGAAAGADISIALKDDTTVKWQTYIGSGAVRGERVGIVFAHGIEITENKNANLVVGAGGASVVTSLNMAGYTK